MGTKTTKTTKTHATKTHAVKPRTAPSTQAPDRTAPGRGAKPVAAKPVTMTGPGVAVAHEAVQAGDLVSHAPPTPQMLVQAGHNAGILCGYRQALKACADNLRAQASKCRDKAGACSVWEMGDRIRLGAVARDLDACAAIIEAQHAAKASEEQQHTRAAEAMLATVGQARS